MTDPKKQKTQVKSNGKLNLLESLKDLGTGVVQDAAAQVLRTPEPYQKPQNEITNSAELRYIQEQHMLRARIALERQNAEDEKRISNEKLGQLRVHLQALISEVAKAQVAAGGLAESARTAILNPPADAGIYHINFFQKFLEYLNGVTLKINEVSAWMGGFSTRENKKNFWSTYKNKKKGGAGFLLNGETYAQRSAG